MYKYILLSTTWALLKGTASTQASKHDAVKHMASRYFTIFNIKIIIKDGLKYLLKNEKG